MKDKDKDQVGSLRFQSMKALRKVVKLVRGFFVQRCSRRIVEIKAKIASGESSSVLLEGALHELEVLKEVDYGKLAEAIYEAQLANFDGKSTLAGEQFLCQILDRYENLDPKVGRQFATHKKVSEALKLWQSKLESAIWITKSKSEKALKVKPRISSKERTTAVFLDSLEADDEKAVEERQRRKELRKQQTRRPPPKSPQMPRPGDTPKQDLSKYGPSAPASRPSPERRQPQQRLSEAPQVAQAVMHPSWIAKQAQKAKLASISVAKNANYSSTKKKYFDD